MLGLCRAVDTESMGRSLVMSRSSAAGQELLRVQCTGGCAVLLDSVMRSGTHCAICLSESSGLLRCDAAMCVASICQACASRPDVRSLHDAACGELPSLSSTRKPLPNGNKSVRVHMMTQAPRRTGKPLLSPCNAPWPTAWVLATAIRKSVPSRRAARLGSSSTTLKSQIEPAFCKEPYK